jgi:transcriptional regulator GlxA family with amidase domain
VVADDARVARTAVFAIYPGFQALDLAGPHEVLAAAGIEILVAAPDAGPVASESGLAVHAARALREIDPESVDTLVVAGGDGVYEAANDPDTVAWVAIAGAVARRAASVCTGAYLLAAAGLLDGRRATTHWDHAARLARAFPAVVVDADPIFVRAGSVWTSAGVTAGIDLALALVEEDRGAAEAQRIARRLVMGLRRSGGQSQYAPSVWSEPAPPGGVRRVQERIHREPGADLSVPTLARAAHMSERHFQRVFAAQVGMPPRRYVERARLEAARRLLEADEAPVEAVARTTGFGTAETMRRVFRRHLGVAPSDYRARFALTSHGGAA